MKCEALTYTAHVTDYSVRASAPEISGRSSLPKGESLGGEAVSALNSPNIVMTFWLWMSIQLTAMLTSVMPPKPLAVAPSHIWHVPNADPNAPKICVRVNRSIARKLRRLERIRPASEFVEEPYRAQGVMPHLSSSQYLDYMIRKHKWSRVRVFGLGFTLRELMWRAGQYIGKGICDGLGRNPLCAAPLSPD